MESIRTGTFLKDITTFLIILMPYQQMFQILMKSKIGSIKRVDKGDEQRPRLRSTARRLQSKCRPEAAHLSRSSHNQKVQNPSD